MTSQTSETIRRARAALLEARRTYKHTIIDAHYSGASVREIAGAAGVTHGAIHQIIKAERSRA